MSGKGRTLKGGIVRLLPALSILFDGRDSAPIKTAGLTLARLMPRSLSRLTKRGSSSSGSSIESSEEGGEAGMRKYN